MKVEKITEIKFTADNGAEIKNGDRVVFECAAKCYAGIFRGINSRGAVMFDSVICGADVRFNIMPTSIEKIYKADILIDNSVPIGESNGD
jgi:hypothetical protein